MDEIITYVDKLEKEAVEMRDKLRVITDAFAEAAAGSYHDEYGDEVINVDDLRDLLGDACTF